MEKARPLKNLRKIKFILLKSPFVEKIGLSLFLRVEFARKRSCEQAGNYNNKVTVIRCNESGPFYYLNKKTTRAIG